MEKYQQENTPRSEPKINPTPPIPEEKEEERLTLPQTDPVLSDVTNTPAKKPRKATLWNRTLQDQRTKHGLKGIPKRGTPEHARVTKAYERALKKEARENKKAKKK